MSRLICVIAICLVAFMCSLTLTLVGVSEPRKADCTSQQLKGKK